jgi:hypothetical protein
MVDHDPADIRTRHLPNAATPNRGAPVDRRTGGHELNVQAERVRAAVL